MKNCLLDTDILINWLRGEKWEKALLLRSDLGFYFTRVSRKELFRYKPLSDAERKKINYLLGCLREIPISGQIAEAASELLTKYAARGLKPADAIIAATAWSKKFVLITRNLRHYRFIVEISLYDSND